MRVLVSGSTGLVGRALATRLADAGHDVTPLVRPETSAATGGIPWDPSSASLDPERLEGFDAVVHLAGESINQRWNDRVKRRIRESRVRGTRLLAETLSGLDDPPAVMVSASAVGYYGDRGATWLEEDAEPGDLFISDVCRHWEAASRAAAESGVRVVNARMGVVLSRDGGALPRMLPPFEFGVGGRLGSGDQYMAWVTREDAVRAIVYLLETERLEGPVNVCSPEPVTNETFTEALGEALRRPTVFRVPRFGVRLLFGQMGEELLLASQRVRPAKLEASGFSWNDPEIGPALENVLASK